MNPTGETQLFNAVPFLLVFLAVLAIVLVIRELWAKIPSKNPAREANPTPGVTAELSPTARH